MPTAAAHAHTYGQLPPAPDGIALDTGLAARQAFHKDVDVEGPTPLAVAHPKSTEQIQSLLRWANAHKIPVIPASSTGLRRRGDTVPSVPSVVADLSGMSRLIHVDPRDRIAIVEPGISFGMIDALLAPHGLRSFKPLRPRAGKSVITAFLDREPITQPDAHWDVADPLGGMEIVLGNGEVLKTGGAAIPMPIEQQIAHGHRQMIGPGPAYQDIQRVIQGAQGSLAIVSWSALFVSRIPHAEKAWITPSDTLVPLIEMAYELLHRRLGTEIFIVNNVQLALILADHFLTEQKTTSECFTDWVARMPAWSLFVTLAADSYAPTEKMKWQTADLIGLAAKHGLCPVEQIGVLNAAHIQAALHQPTERAYQDIALGSHQSLFFLQQLHRAPEFVEIASQSAAQGLVTPHLLGVYLQPIIQGSSCHIALTIPHQANESGSSIAKSSCHRISINCAEAGAFFSRPYGDIKKIAFTSDQSIKPYLDMTKRILDPNNILNPGRF